MLDDRAANAALAAELADGAEEVVPQPEQAEEVLQDGKGGGGAVTVGADEAADGEPVARLDLGLIILAGRAAAAGRGALARSHFR